ncbi:MAG: 2-amino-4-hydroxy-6-hydroxymethyldihydropteridine diphosphokinase [bacterium]|nr:2-amino-4-hydroxy-6-hydroxymethyldihydropteridine diphosphokinase [bacterium]
MGTLVYLSLGSNLGNRKQYIEEALQRISARTGQIESRSSFYETAPWGFESEQQFLNICAALTTELTPLQLLNEFQTIEKELGRNKKKQAGYVSRVIDIDILAFGDDILSSDELTVPHPGIENRKFVLLPLVEIAPNFIHPKTAKTIKQIIASCSDESSVLLYENK